MSPRELFALWDAGVTFAQMDRLALLRWLNRDRYLGPKRPQPLDEESWSVAQHHVPRMGYRP